MKPSKNIMFIVLLLAVCLTQFASDIYTPSLSAIATDFKVSMGAVQWTMAIYMLGVALSQLIYGPLSEGLGRKLPLCIGLSIMCLGSVCAYLSHDIQTLIISRLIQGLGAGACASLWRSVFRDIFTGDDLAKYGSYFSIIITFIVPVAPALGGYLQHYNGWQASFAFMLAYAGLSLLLLLFCFQETSHHHDKSRLNINYALTTYKQMLTDRHFMGISLATFLCYGALFASIATFPALLLHELRISPVVFGWLSFAGCGGAYALAGFINGYVVKRLGMWVMMRFALIGIFICGCLLLISWQVVGLNFWAVLIPIILFNFAATFIWPNAFAAAFTPYGQIAGYAGALYGFMQISGGAALGSLIAYLPSTTPMPLAIVMLSAALLGWMTLRFIARVHQA